MFGYEYFDIMSEEFEHYVNKIVDKKLKEIKVRIPQEQINNAVVKFFTEKKWFLTENGKKLDTYDLIRKFAMNTIGVGENGELKPEMLKIVQEEVAKIIADTYFNDNSAEAISKKCSCGCNDNSQEEIKETLIEESDDANSVDNAHYTDGYTDGTICTVNTINEILKDAGINDIHFYWDGDEIMLSNNRNASLSLSPTETSEEESIEIDPKLINAIANKFIKMFKE